MDSVLTESIELLKVDLLSIFSFEPMRYSLELFIFSSESLSLDSFNLENFLSIYHETDLIVFSLSLYSKSASLFPYVYAKYL